MLGVKIKFIIQTMSYMYSVKYIPTLFPLTKCMILVLETMNNVTLRTVVIILPLNMTIQTTAFT